MRYIVVVVAAASWIFLLLYSRVAKTAGVFPIYFSDRLMLILVNKGIKVHLKRHNCLFC